ncbi:MAG: hypothetical protein Phog2KO_47190 [Phototrophicaceae bacterium]
MLYFVCNYNYNLYKQYMGIIMKKLQQRIILIALLFSVTLLNIIPTLAQEAETSGRAVTQQDWLNFMPVLIGAIIIVLVVDAVFIIPIFRKKDDEKDAQS